MEETELMHNTMNKSDDNRITIIILYLELKSTILYWWKGVYLSHCKANLWRKAIQLNLKKNSPRKLFFQRIFSLVLAEIRTPRSAWCVQCCIQNRKSNLNIRISAWVTIVVSLFINMDLHKVIATSCSNFHEIL